MRTPIIALVSIVVGISAASAEAQSQFPPPSTPVAACFTQPSPVAESHQLIFDGGAPEALETITPASPDSPTKAACNGAGVTWTHAATIPAARFTLGEHTVQIRAVNAFGQTLGNVFNAVIGIAPGPPTITAIVQTPPADN